ncbi:MAG: hypothetical protein Q9217_005480 [Psora testacea]
MASIRSNSSLYDPQHTSQSSSSLRTADLEKADTQPDLPLTTSSSRVTRIPSLVNQRTTFDHPLSYVKTGRDVLVDFDGPDDSYRPLNWPLRKKITTTVLYALTTMGSTWASSAYSPAVNQISSQFHVSREVSLLGLSVLLYGFGLGPLIWAPLSEVFGRKPAVLIPYFLAAVFSFGTATAKDIQTIIITRFFAGFFASAPTTNTGGVLGDIWSPTERGTAMACYSFAVVGGPVLGPIAGGAIVQSYLRWRWTEYLSGIMMMTILALDVLILDESYAPRLLVYKARRLRIERGNWALHAKFEEWDVSLKDFAIKFGVRPFQMLLTPICFLVTLFASFVYGLLYANLAAFPIEFGEERGWNLLVSALPFLAFLIGIILGGATNVINQSYYNHKFVANGGKPVPEARLPPMMVGSVVFAGGLFIFGWTSPKTIHWIAPCFGAVMMGFGFFTIFQSAQNYLVDTFERYAASAIAANTFLRSTFAASFPLFVSPMYHKLGIPWASSVFGFFAVALIPIPFLFAIYGKRLRAHGRYSANMG